MEFFNIIINNSTIREKFFGLLLCLMFGFYHFSFFIFSILFYKPILLCDINGI